MSLPAPLEAIVASGPLAHLVTLGRDGTPQVSVAWIGVEDGEIVLGTLFDQRKLRNLRRDPRVALSLATGSRTSLGLDEYVVLHGTARVTEGGAAALLGRLARVYLGPDVRFPPMPDPPPGFVVRCAIDAVTGNAPWVRDLAGGSRT